MAGLYNPSVNERELLKRVDNLMLLTISVTLRAITIAVSAGVQLAQPCEALRNEFSGAFPHSFVGAAIGLADVDDIVSVFASPDIFVGIVEQKRGGAGHITQAKAEAAGKAASDLPGRKEHTEPRLQMRLRQQSLLHRRGQQQRPSPPQNMSRI